RRPCVGAALLHVRDAADRQQEVPGRAEPGFLDGAPGYVPCRERGQILVLATRELSETPGGPAPRRVGAAAEARAHGLVELREGLGEGRLVAHGGITLTGEDRRSCEFRYPSRAASSVKGDCRRRSSR